MIIKLMGILDLIGAILLVLLQFDIIGAYFRFMLIIAFYLVGKGIIFKGDFASMIDFFSGIYFVLAFFGFQSFIAYIIAIFLLQKSFFSLKMG